MKKPPAKVHTETEKKQIVYHDHNDDVLKIDDNNFITDISINNFNNILLTGKDIADCDMYDKEVPFADGLNSMQRNAVSLHLFSVKREYAIIDNNDQDAIKVFWRRVKEIIHEEHGFMSKDTDAVMDILRKNVE